MSEDKRERIQCNQCGGKTWHRQVGMHTVEGSEELEEEFFVSWYDSFELFQCLGCDDLTARRTLYYNPSDVEVSYLPPRIFRRRPEWLDQIPDEAGGILREIYSALAANNKRLALMGIRAALDVVIVEKVSDIGTFDTKLKALEAAGHVGANQRAFLAAVIDAGSAASHRAYLPEEQDLVASMDILENLLHSVYVLEGAAKTIATKTPKRVRRREPEEGDA